MSAGSLGIIAGNAAVAAAGASWTALTAASADNTIAGQGSVTWSDEAGGEMRATVDLSTSQVFNNLANHGGLQVYDTGLTVSDDPVVNLRFTPTTTPNTGTDVYMIIGVGIASSTAFDPATDKSFWWVTLYAPLTSVGTSAQNNAKANNNSTGTSATRADSDSHSSQTSMRAGSRAASGAHFYNSGAAVSRISSTATIAGQTATDKVLVVIASGHRVVDTPTETLGGTFEMLAVAAAS